MCTFLFDGYFSGVELLSKITQIGQIRKVVSFSFKLGDDQRWWIQCPEKVKRSKMVLPGQLVSWL